MIDTRFVNGPFKGSVAQLTRTPPQLVIAGYTYDRIDDPDTGEYLGAYCLHFEGEFRCD
jgi:hypothetical protein